MKFCLWPQQNQDFACCFIKLFFLKAFLVLSFLVIVSYFFPSSYSFSNPRLSNIIPLRKTCISLHKAHSIVTALSCSEEHSRFPCRRLLLNKQFVRTTYTLCINSGFFWSFKNMKVSLLCSKLFRETKINKVSALIPNHPHGIYFSMAEFPASGPSVDI